MAVAQFLKRTGRHGAQRLMLRVDLKRVGGRTRQRPVAHGPRQQPMLVRDLEKDAYIVFERQVRIFGENQGSDPRLC
jgi:hypothetical protein